MGVWAQTQPDKIIVHIDMYNASMIVSRRAGCVFSYHLFEMEKVLEFDFFFFGEGSIGPVPILYIVKKAECPPAWFMKSGFVK